VVWLGGAALGTSWQVRFAASRDLSLDRLRVLIERRLAGIVAEMSQWDPASLLSRFNRAPAGAWFSLPEDFAAVLTAALGVARRSGGAFDPTHGRAAALLGFGAQAVSDPPSPTELEDAHAAAGWERLHFEPATRLLRQPGGLWLDFSGIGKGYAVDALADLLRTHGIADVLVEIGGELVGRGLRPDGEPWWVDLEPPPGAAALPPLRIGLHENAVATSGDYVRGAHTLDPFTGQPLERRVAAVSVVHANAMLADAWATALTVLGPNAGLAMAEREGIAARFVTRKNAGFAEALSPAMRALIDG
jgi:thiamine biosynthesis lipoprotein